ncbi:Long-chain-fatty-acid--CoA ligase 5, partial [Dictyocoela roeselum]
GICQKIQSEVSKRPLILRLIFYIALKTKIFLQRFNIYRNSFLDNFVFAQVQREFGGRLRAGLTGSAPINKDVKKYIQAVLGIRLFEGYGQLTSLTSRPTPCAGLWAFHFPAISLASRLMKILTALQAVKFC